MWFSKLTISLLLSLALILGAGLSAAHSHDGHEEDECAYSVVQHNSASVAALPEFSFVTLNYQNHPPSRPQTLIHGPRTAFLARAPPLSL
ncbi:MAG: hypothetical protein ACPG3V_04890 [Porticoccaceae bacterium]